MYGKTGDGAADGRVLNYTTGRRGFLGTLGLGAAGLAAAGALTLGSTEAQAVTTDADILNFALNLEYLEAEYYVRAAFGRGLADADVQGAIGTLGPVSGGRQVDFTGDPLIGQYAKEIASDEEQHVKFLRSALGGPGGSVARPAIDIQASFTALARAAGLIGPAPATFDPYASPNNFLLGAFVFEDVGVTAYHGAAPLIQSGAILDAAAGILAIEAYHAGLVRTVLYARSFFDQAGAIAALRSSINGTQKDKGIRDQIVFGNIPAGQIGGPATFVTASNIVAADAQGLAFERTTNQVLNVVYGNITTPPQPGGFFPNGMNGNIR